VDKPNPLKLLDDQIGEHLRESEAALRRDAAAASDPEQARTLAKKASDLEQLIRLRPHRYRSGSI
jgi:hypothetical protein